MLCAVRLFCATCATCNHCRLWALRFDVIYLLIPFLEMFLSFYFYGDSRMLHPDLVAQSWKKENKRQSDDGFLYGGENGKISQRAAIDPLS